MLTAKRKRAAVLPSIYLQGSSSGFDENETTIQHLLDSKQRANVALVQEGWYVPASLALVTNSILFLDNIENVHTLNLDNVHTLQQMNQDLYVFSFWLLVSCIDATIMLIDWKRVHAAHIIMRGYPDNAELYTAYYKQLQNTGANVCHELSTDGGRVDPDMHLRGPYQFVMTETNLAGDWSSYWNDWRGRWAYLPPGSSVIHLRSLTGDGRQEKTWNSTALKELQTGEQPVKRQRSADTLADALAEPQRLERELDRALQIPVQNPKLVEQPYHKYQNEARHDFNPRWYSFMQGEHPQFCSFGHMFCYLTRDNPQTLLEWQGRRFSLIPTKGIPGAFLVNDNLLSAIKGCGNRFFMGFLRVETKRSAHANALIMDRSETGTWELSRFEPHGAYTSTYDSDAVDTSFRDFFQNNPQYEVTSYVAPSQFCTQNGPQRTADRYDFHDFLDKRKDRKDSGWCKVISIMFIHYRLAFLTHSIVEVERMLSGKDPHQLATEIRSYTNSIMRHGNPKSSVRSLYTSTTLRITNGPGHLVLGGEMYMDPQYPDTPFKRMPWHQYVCLLHFNGIIRDTILLVRTLSNKTLEPGPRAVMRKIDFELTQDAELIMLFQVLQTRMEIRTVTIEISQGDRSYEASLVEERKMMSVEQALEDMRLTLDQDLFIECMTQELEAQGVQVDDSMSPTDIMAVYTARCKNGQVNVWEQWTRMKSLRRRAEYYVELGFQVDAMSHIDVVFVTSTRDHIISKYNQHTKRWTTPPPPECEFLTLRFDNAQQVDKASRVLENCSSIGVLVVPGSLELVPPFAAVRTNLILLPDVVDHPAHITQLLEANPALNIRCHSVVLDFDVAIHPNNPVTWTNFLESPARERFRAEHVVIRDFPVTQEEFDKVLAGLGGSSADVVYQMLTPEMKVNVYQMLAPEMKVEWLKAAGISTFVTDSRSTILRAEDDFPSALKVAVDRASVFRLSQLLVGKSDWLERQREKYEHERRATQFENQNTGYKEPSRRVYQLKLKEVLQGRYPPQLALQDEFRLTFIDDTNRAFFYPRRSVTYTYTAQEYQEGMTMEPGFLLRGYCEWLVSVQSANYMKPFTVPWDQDQYQVPWNQGQFQVWWDPESDAMFFCRAPSSLTFRRELRQIFSRPVSNPFGLEQAYHHYRDSLADCWLSFLQQAHPTFCFVHNDMFRYQHARGDLLTDNDVATELYANFARPVVFNTRAAIKMMFKDRTGVYDSNARGRTPIEVARGSEVVPPEAFGVHRDLLQCIRDCPHRFVVGLLKIYLTNERHHTNAIIIDTVAGTLSRFDPDMSDAAQDQDLDLQLRNFTTQHPNLLPGGYVPPKAFCPLTRMQTQAERYHDFERRTEQYRHLKRKRPDFKTHGWASVLCLMFIHHRLAFLELTDTELAQMGDQDSFKLALDIWSYANAVVTQCINNGLRFVGYH